MASMDEVDIRDGDEIVTIRVPSEWSDDQAKQWYFKQKGAAPENKKAPEETPYTPKKQPPPLSAAYWNAKFPEVTPQLGAEPQNQRAAAKGVDIDTGAEKLGTGGYFAAGMAMNEKQRNLYLTQQIQQQYGKQTPIRVGKDSGKLEYVNPDTGRWTMAVPDEAPGAYKIGGDVLPGIVEGGAAAGTAAAVGLSAIPTGGWSTLALTTLPGAAAGAARYGVEKLKGKAAPYLGLPELSPEEQDNVALKEAGKTAALNVALDAGLWGIGKGGRWFLRGSPLLSEQEARNLLPYQGYYKDDIDRVDRVVNMNYPEMTGGQGMEISAAQRAGAGPKPRSTFEDEAARDAQTGAGLNAPALSRQAQLAQNPELAANETRRRARNQSFIQVFYQDRLLRPFGVTPDDSRFEAGKWFRSFLDRMRTNNLSPAEENLLRQNEGLQNAMETFPQNLDPQTVGMAVRKQLAEADAAEYAAVNKQFADYREYLGMDPKETSSKYMVNIEKGPLADELAALDARQRNALFSFEKGAYTPFQLNAKESAILDAKGNPFMTVPKEVDLASIEQALHNLRQRRYSAKHSPSGDLTLSSKQANDLENALVQQRNQFLEKNNPAALEMAISADKNYHRYKNNFDRNFIGQLLQRNAQGDYVLSDTQIPKAIWDNLDEQGAWQLSSYINADPAANTQMKQFMLAMFNKKYLSDGPLTPKKYERFLAEEYKIVEPFLTSEEQMQVRRVGGFAKAVADAQYKYDQLNKKWKETFIGRLAGGPENVGVNAEQLVKAVFSEAGSENSLGSVRDVIKLREVAKQGGDQVYENWRRGVVNEFVRRSTDANDQVTLEGLRNQRNKFGDKLERILGKQWIKDLDTILNVIKVSEASGEPFKMPPLGTDLQRLVLRPTIARPLSAEGVLMSGFNQRRQRRQLEELERVLYDPEALRDLANRSQRDRMKLTKAAGIVGGAVGLAEVENAD